jgi:hypothetical protein
MPFLEHGMYVRFFIWMVCMQMMEGPSWDSQKHLTCMSASKYNLESFIVE